MGETKKALEPYLLAVLARRFDFITKEMANTLLRSARSGVVNTAHDFSCATVDAQCRAVSVADASPCHIGGAGLQIKILQDLFGEDIHPGDCFINTCAYYGNTHNGDFTIFAPVFYEGKCLFYTFTRAHQADIGAPTPSTYLAFEKTIYEEGLQLPCVRIQRDYKDIEDITRICKIRIRVPEQWYGDYLAQIGAVRIGERRLIELCDKYGVDVVQEFCDEWQEYGKRRMIEEIRKLPKGVLKGECRHDPVPGVAPDGIPIRVTIDIDPDEGFVTIDLTDNIDNVAGGFNLTEATVTAAAMIGVMHCVSPTIPHNEGSFSRVKIKLREGCVVGIPKYPVGTGLATTNLADRLTALVESTFAQLGPPYGVAEGCTSLASAQVISGVDWRHDNAPYINELLLVGGGPGVYGHDGWIVYGVPQDNGIMYQDSIEIDEQKYPIIFDKVEFATDSCGDGQWRGAPATDVMMGPRNDPCTMVWINEQHYFPAKGVLGGTSPRPSNILKYKMDTQETVQLPQLCEEVFQPGERCIGVNTSGGGYGDPLDRDPDLVRWDVREEIISLKKAEEVYGVVLDTEPEQYAVDYAATEKLRERLRNERRKGQ